LSEMSAFLRAFVATAAVVLLCATTALCEVYSVQASFTETKATLPNASFTGTLAYRYDSTNASNCRLLIKYQLPGSRTVSDMYHYGVGAKYSMFNSQCTGSRVDQKIPDAWYVTSNYTKGAASGSMFWYTRKANSAAQVKRILMTASTAPTASGYKVDTIEFNDGRVFKLTNFKYVAAGLPDSTFAILKSCPEPQCPIYADIVFVLDFSGSVSKESWADTMNFVLKVTNSFTLGYDGVAAAAVQFTHAAKMIAPDVTEAVLADMTNLKGAPMYTKASFMSLINAYMGKTPAGSTFQGTGLIFAKNILKKGLKSRPNKKPAGIVIAVTDGEDWHQPETAAAAEALKKELGALVVEIGVGQAHNNAKFREFLKSIASKLGGKPVYYNVSEYSGIKNIVDQITRPLCDQFSTDVCSNCKGLCSNGKCFCPTCTATGSTCYSNTCSESGSSSTGCVVTPIKCDPNKFPENVCQSYKCDGTKTDAQGRCTVVKNDCSAMKQKYPEKCREVQCSTSVKDGCFVSLNDAYCQAQFGDACTEYECTPVGQTVPPDFKDSGCRLKTDKRKEIQKQLDQSGESKCFRAFCDPVTGVIKQDFCEESNTYNKCYSSKCTKDGNTYKCKNTEKNRPTDTNCVTYTCSTDATKGWVVKSQNNTSTCTTYFEGKQKGSTKCKNVYCDPKTAGGCKMDTIEGCRSECTNDFIKTCIADSAKAPVSSVSRCVLGQCVVVTKSGGLYDLKCDQTHSSNCLVEKADEVAKLNKGNPSVCYTPTCGTDGRCAYQSLPIPSGFTRTKCMEPVCVKQSDGSWKWDYLPTEVNKTCKSDECLTRTCDASKGCVGTDICLVKNKQTDCVEYSCSAGKCVSKSLLKTTYCTYEECENGKKVMKDNLEPCNKKLPDLCTVSVCVYNTTTQTSTCGYKPKPPPDENPCNIYECDLATGEFSRTNPCVDDEFCTDDECNFCSGPGCEKGYICKHKERDCGAELSMEGYPCFLPTCREENHTYRCWRKIIRNAYVDICGRCILDKEVVVTEGSSSSASSSSENITELVECTGAPARPAVVGGLAAASIALIIIFAILLGALVAASSVVATKTLVGRAKGAGLHNAVSNPFYEGATEMENPYYEAPSEMAGYKKPKDELRKGLLSEEAY